MKSRGSLEYFEALYSSKLENLDDIDKFLDVDNQPKLNQEDNNHINRTIQAMKLK
jgi:hypothetical protein